MQRKLRCKRAPGPAPAGRSPRCWRPRPWRRNARRAEDLGARRASMPSAIESATVASALATSGLNGVFHVAASPEWVKEPVGLAWKSSPEVFGSRQPDLTLLRGAHATDIAGSENMVDPIHFDLGSTGAVAMRSDGERRAAARQTIIDVARGALVRAASCRGRAARPVLRGHK